MKKLEPYYMHKRNMLDVFLVSMFLLSVLTISVSKVNAATQVSVQPSSQTVGQEDVLLPTSLFAINITVQDVEDLYMWQIVLYYNSTILSTRKDLIILPLGHVFEGKTFYKVGPLIENDTKGTYIFFGATLSYPELSGVNEPGVLCQIKFTGQVTGTSELNLGDTTDGDDSTLLADSYVNDIPCEISDGEVTVIGRYYPREPSEITINVNPLTITVGSNVTITGTINPTRVGANVTIYYLPFLGKPGNATVQTNELSSYEYNWTAEEADEYELYAYWPGDANYTEATSNIVTVTVLDKWPSNISLNVYPTKVPVGSNAIINGTIITQKPTLPYEKVTISYKRKDGNWTTLATVYPGENGVYTHTWKPNEVGSYELKASWPGDEYSEPADRSVQIEVIRESIAYLYYIIAAIAIVAIAIIGIYFTKIRKR